MKDSDATVGQISGFMWETFSVSENVHPAHIIFIFKKKKRFPYAIYFLREMGTPGGECGYILGGRKWSLAEGSRHLWTPVWGVMLVVTFPSHPEEWLQALQEGPPTPREEGDIGLSELQGPPWSPRWSSSAGQTARRQGLRKPPTADALHLKGIQPLMLDSTLPLKLRKASQVLWLSLYCNTRQRYARSW